MINYCLFIFTNYIARRAVPGEMKVSDEVKSPKRTGGQILFYNRKQRTLSLLEQLNQKLFLGRYFIQQIVVNKNKYQKFVNFWFFRIGFEK